MEILTNRCKAYFATRLRRSSSVALVAMSLVASAPAQAATSAFLKNVVPAIYSYDSSMALLGLQYGIDPTFPVLVADGFIDSSGFNWSTTGLYLGSTVTWSQSGIFDAASDSTTWSGTGSYMGHSWTMAGVTAWTSDTDFLITDSISFDGALNLYSSDAFGAPGSNAGTISGAEGSSIEIEELKTSHWYNWFGGHTTDGWVVRLDENGKIKSNVYTLAEDGTTVGVTAKLAGGLDGHVTFGGGKFVKAGFDTSDKSGEPEPSSWALMLGGFGLVGTALRSRRRKATLAA